MQPHQNQLQGQLPQAQLTQKTDPLSHLVRRRLALAPFCEALGRPASEALISILAADLPHAARLWAASIDFVSTVVVSLAEVVARGAHFVAAAARALVPAHIPPPGSDEASAPRRRPRRRPRLAPAP